MKHWIFALMVAAVSATGAVQASGCGNSCDPCCNQCCDPCCDPCCCDPCGCFSNCCCGTIEVIGEALYLRPSTCDLNYAIRDSRDFSTVDSQTLLPQGKERGVCPDYQWGFRIGVGYVMDCTCYDARITYTRLDTTDRNDVQDTEVQQSAGGIWITYAHPNFAERVLFNDGQVAANASQRFKTEYNAVDLEVGSRGMKGCDFWFRAHAGLHYANICNTRIVHYEGAVRDFTNTPTNVASTYDVRGHNKVWGIGPRFGFDWRYDIACGFGIGGNAGVGILAGETRSKQFEHVVQASPLTVDQTLDVQQRSRCLVVPELDARLGVNYLFCCGDCFSLLVEVGYEWHSYIGALDHTVFNDVAGTSSAVCENYNLDGVYISFRLQI